MSASKLFVAEAVGTFFLCFAGIGAILSTQAPINSGAGLVGIALAHGLALSIAVSIFAGISGAHHNPPSRSACCRPAASRRHGRACTLPRSWSAQRWRRSCAQWCYWVAPIAGAIAAAQLYQHVLLAPEKKPQ